jgi:hypothetical protein
MWSCACGPLLGRGDSVGAGVGEGGRRLRAVVPGPRFHLFLRGPGAIVFNVEPRSVGRARILHCLGWSESEL